MLVALAFPKVYLREHLALVLLFLLLLLFIIIIIIIVFTCAFMKDKKHQGNAKGKSHAI